MQRMQSISAHENVALINLKTTTVQDFGKLLEAEKLVSLTSTFGFFYRFIFVEYKGKSY